MIHLASNEAIKKLKLTYAKDIDGINMYSKEESDRQIRNRDINLLNRANSSTFSCIPTKKTGML